MKNILKVILGFFLALLARAVVRRYHPQVVMVTGSVGKTSTKDAVATVLMQRFLVRKSEKSFNSEFGVPFTILGVENPWHNPLAWFAVLKRAVALLVLPNHYPNMLVLEVGSGAPGDLAHILRIVHPDAVVVTCLPEIPVHVEAYASPDAVREEEFSPAYALHSGAPLIVPADDPYALGQAIQTPTRIFSYGESDGATVQLAPPSFYEAEHEVQGMRTEVTTADIPDLPGEKGEIVVKGSVGSAQVLPAAAAVATGLAFSISLTDSLAALAAYEPPPGRGRLLEGKNGSIIVDDSYNASPAAVEQALQTLKVFPHAKRRVAVLGDMLELGRYSVVEHQRIAGIAHQCADLVVAVGIRARAFTVAPPHGVEVLQYDNAHSAAEALPALIQSGDVVLVKGSQSIRLERVVEVLLADPRDASRLVRQERVWKKK